MRSFAITYVIQNLEIHPILHEGIRALAFSSEVRYNELRRLVITSDALSDIGLQ